MFRSKEAKLAQKNASSNPNSNGSNDGGKLGPRKALNDNSSLTNRHSQFFRCQKAHGSPTGLIYGFSNVMELYQRIAECYSFPMDQILFCTLNTHRIDMSALLTDQPSLEDFIFVHMKGNPKEVEITKTNDTLGLTLTENGTGYAIINRIKDGSIIRNTGVIEVGDHLEEIGGRSVVGWKHMEVTKYLRNIPVGQTFILRLVEPIRIIDSRTNKQNGLATLKIADSSTEMAISKLKTLIEDFVGINDFDLAKRILDMANGRKNVEDFIHTLQNSELESFEFSEKFLVEAWTIVTQSFNQLNF